MTARRTKILLVDDTLTIRKLARVILGSDYDYVEAENGEQANLVARAEQPQLIVMDLNMPVKDGVAGLDDLKAEPTTRAIPVIILTSETEQSLRTRCVELGCAEFLQKPLDKTLLRSAVTRCLSSR